MICALNIGMNSILSDFSCHWFTDISTISVFNFIFSWD